MSYNTNYSYAVFTSKPVLAGTKVHSEIIAFDVKKLVGFFSLQYSSSSSGIGKVNFRCLLSNDGINFDVEDNTADIAKDVLNARGFTYFSPAVALFMIIEAEETGLVDPATVSATLCFQ